MSHTYDGHGGTRAHLAAYDVHRARVFAPREGPCPSR